MASDRMQGALDPPPHVVGVAPDEASVSAPAGHARHVLHEEQVEQVEHGDEPVDAIPLDETSGGKVLPAQVAMQPDEQVGHDLTNLVRYRR
ncbi:MAG: hypothetical protein ABIQ53_12655 [Terracoccus sp.]